MSFPGSNYEPGHRDIQDESHLIFGPDTNPGITNIFYNFAFGRSYGNNAAGQPVFTSITPEQVQRVREIFDIFSSNHGIDFVETENAGLTIVVGDMWPLGRVSGPGGVAGVAGGSLAIMDGAESWDNSFGGGFFTVAMHEIGHLLGHLHSYDLPPGTIMGGEPELSSGPTEWSYPGDHDIVHGQHMHRRDNRDVDMYSFVVPAGQAGRLRVEALAERLANSSNLDSYVTLFRQSSRGLEIVASNDNSLGRDSYLAIDLPLATEAITYFVSITSKGNEDFHPQVANTGSGGFSQGSYQLRVSFDSTVSPDPASLTIQDIDGTPLDGNSDGRPGGNFDFWFRAIAPSTGVATSTPKTIFVDKAYTGATSTVQPHNR